MKKSRVLGVIFGPDCFKIVFLIASILGVCPLLSGEITPFLKLFHVYAVIVLVVDLFTEQRIIHNKGRFLLVLFALSYVGTLLTNVNLINLSGISNVAYLLTTLGLVYSYGKDSEKADRIGETLACMLLSVANLIGICMFFSKYCEYYPDKGYIGMFPQENRLCGLFGNPNVLGMVSLCGIYFSSTLFVLSNHKKIRCLYAIAGVINLTALLLSNSRTQMYSLIFSCAVFACVQVLKGKKGIKGFSLSVLSAVLVAVVAFCGMRLVQSGLSAVDINYDHYLEQVQDENASMDVLESAESDEFIQTIQRNDSSLNGRLELWVMGIPLVKAKPLFGIGLDNHDHALAALGMDGLKVRGNLHNVYLEVIVCCGFAGFACLVVFLLILFSNVVKFFRCNDGESWTFGALLLAEIAGFMLDGVADSTLIASVYPTAISFWYISSQLSCLIERENQKNNNYKPELLGKMVDKSFKKDTKSNK